jgi:8-oxo-dGTP pyrophosphatase MutT (NUDIX family)
MSRVWKPSVTVAAVVERGGRFLLVEEHTDDGLRINQPAGHLERGETLLQAVAREALEETAHPFRPTALLGVYLWRSPGHERAPTYLRFAFTGELDEPVPGRALDRGIVRAVWMSRQELAQHSGQWRSPLVGRCIDDYLDGQRYPLELLFAHPDALTPAAQVVSG